MNKRNISGSRYLIWDEDDLPLFNDTKVILWQHFNISESPKLISIPSLVEKNSNHLRARYLKWIYDLGKFKVGNKRIVDHLKIRPGFNYWWMTLIIEKSYGKSSAIYDSIRLLAFADLLKKRSIGHIVLRTSNQNLAICIKNICFKSNIIFDCHIVKKKSLHLNWLKNLYQNFPNSLKAFIWLARYVIDRWPLREGSLKCLKIADSHTTFFSYLFNLESSALKKGHFCSSYWAHLPGLLKRENYKTNWVHIYTKSEQIPTSKNAAKIIYAFNKAGGQKQTHVALDNFLSLKVIFQTLYDWFFLFFIQIGLRKKICVEEQTGINLWPLFEDDWKNSMCGVVAMQNLLNYHLLKALLVKLPKQTRGFYLQENQGWEFGLIQIWKLLGHGQLIGVPHSTVRFWDLRYFFDPKCYSKKIDYALPLPSKVAINGPFAFQEYKKGGYPTSNLVEIEALRYMHFLKSKDKKIINNVLKSSVDKELIRVLILGDFLKSNTHSQLSMLEKAIPFLSVKIIFTVKPHPACLINPNEYPKIKMILDESPIEKLLAKSDVVFTGAATSAVVDAYCAGLPIVSLLDPKTLNLSPLRDFPEILFVRTPENIAIALREAFSLKIRKTQYKHFFRLNFSLYNWRKLLELN